MTHSLQEVPLSPSRGEGRGVVLYITAASLAVLSPAAHAFAEVMDKEATRSDIWWTTALLLLIGLAAWRSKYTVALAAVALMFGCLFYRGIFAELSDASVGPAILREAGRDYPIHARVATTLFIAANLAGLTSALRRNLRLRPGPKAGDGTLPRGFWDRAATPDPGASVRTSRARPDVIDP